MVNSAKKCLWILLISVASPVFGQDTPEVDPVPEVDPPPVRDDGEFEPDFEGDGDDTNIEGDLNTSNSNNNNVNKHRNNIAPNTAYAFTISLIKTKRKRCPYQMARQNKGPLYRRPVFLLWLRFEIFFGPYLLIADELRTELVWTSRSFRDLGLHKISVRYSSAIERYPRTDMSKCPPIFFMYE